MIFRGRKGTWYRPTTLMELVELKSKYPDARLVVGNTEIGKAHIIVYKVKVIMKLIIL